MKTKTAEEIIKEMIDAMPFRLSENIIPYVKEAMEIYRSQASELPSKEEMKIKIKSIIEREDDDFKYKAHRLLMELGNWYNSLASPLLASKDAENREIKFELNLALIHIEDLNDKLASRDARIKELEEQVERLKFNEI